MRQIRFRFDGQPINETDTPSQVRLAPHLQLSAGKILFRRLMTLNLGVDPFLLC